MRGGLLLSASSRTARRIRLRRRVRHCRWIQIARAFHLPAQSVLEAHEPPCRGLLTSLIPCTGTACRADGPAQTDVSRSTQGVGTSSYRRIVEPGKAICGRLLGNSPTCGVAAQVRPAQSCEAVGPACVLRCSLRASATSTEKVYS
jgi:hypothetical protein